ncbi:MAG: DNA internalization-related competence protein ComEC/Rec2 [Gammaproteobacteria bacterium]
MHPLIQTRGTPYILLMPFAIASVAGLMHVRAAPSWRCYLLALCGTCLGAGFAGLDVRPVDTPSHWVDYAAQTFRVYGQIQGLPRYEFVERTQAVHPSHAVAPASPRNQNAHFLFHPRCWIFVEHPDRVANTSGLLTQFYDQYRSTLSRRRRACRDGAVRVPAYFNRLQVHVYRYDGPPLEPGRWVWLELRLRAPRAAINPGSEDHERWFFVNYIGARATWRNDVPLEWGPRSISLDRIRGDISQFVRQTLSDYPIAQRIAPALVVGDRRWLSSEDWRQLSRLGLSHLVAISGLHIGFAAVLGFGVGVLGVRGLSRVWMGCLRYWPAHCWAWLSAWGFAVGYSALAGFSLPTVRAVIMLTVLCLCRWCFFPLSLMRAWVMAAALMLCCMPRSIFDVGFWLSFTAVGILLFLASCQYRFSGYRVLGRLVQAWRLQCKLSIGLIPVNLIFFQQMSWVSPVVNAVAIPLVSVAVVPLLFAALLVSCVWDWGAAMLFQLVGQLLSISWSWAESLATASWVSSGTVFPGGFAGVALLSMVLFCLLPRAWCVRPLALVLGAAVWWHSSAEPVLREGEFRLTMLDVGQGLAIAIETKNQVIVYDAGPGRGDRFWVDRMWLPFLRQRQRDSIRLLVSSHGDADHAGSAAPLVAAVPTEAHTGVESYPFTVLPEDGIIRVSPPYRICRAGDRWRWDGVELVVLYPDATETGATQVMTGERADTERLPRAARNVSCVIEVIGASHRVLLTGDISRKMEAVLLRRERSHSLPVDTLKADVLLVPHHGSKTSSSTGLIHRANPTYAMVSHGYHNAFGHPHPQVKARYVRRGVTWLSTAELGAVTFWSHRAVGGKPAMLSVESEREKRPALWRYGERGF